MVTRTEEEYRPALDGLRAIAVLSVIAYHFGYTWLPGGFLGVDIFFVLSGYLITSLLVREYEATRRIKLGEFWARRARRLLPALLLLLVSVSLWVYWYAPVETWMARRRDLLWTLFYGANWHFIETSQDYFAKYTGTSPLLHTWSLAIEEQFYFLWPLAFFAMARVVRSRRWVMVAVCIVAAIASATRMATLYGSAGLSRAYYGTDGRAQELLVGVALALVPTWATSLVRRRSVLTGLGATFALAVGSFLFLLRDRTPFYYPGRISALRVRGCRSHLDSRVGAFGRFRTGAFNTPTSVGRPYLVRPVSVALVRAHRDAPYGSDERLGKTVAAAATGVDVRCSGAVVLSGRAPCS